MESWIGIRAPDDQVWFQKCMLASFPLFRNLLQSALRKDEFCNIIPMLWRFHTAKYVEHCIGKYIKGSCIQESLRQTQVFGVNVDVNIHSKATLF